MLQSGNIRAYWNTIKPYIDKIADGFDYISEDVYVACIQGQAHLYVSDYGFMVLQQMPIPFTNDSQIFVWVLSKWKDKPGAIRNNIEDLKELAKSVGAKRVTFGTKRPGFPRLLKCFGFRVEETRLTLEI